jgi:thiamine-monophosphate kinase
VEKENLVLRSGAKKGDIIFVSGKLGGSIHGKHLRFIPRIKEARFLVQNYRVNAMIDISDGLLQDLGHILKKSAKGCVIYEELIPKSAKAKDLNEALSWGEDFELLFTLAPKQARALISSGRFCFQAIGEIVDEKYGFKMVDCRGREKKMKPRGFQHF